MNLSPDHPVMLAQTIQLALAPVFVLVAIGNIMNILTNRLARMVDRARHLQTLHAGTKGSEHDGVVAEMRVIDQRIAHIGRALLLLVLLLLETRLAARTLRLPPELLELERGDL